MQITEVAINRHGVTLKTKLSFEDKFNSIIPKHANELNGQHLPQFKTLFLIHLLHQVFKVFVPSGVSSLVLFLGGYTEK